MEEKKFRHECVFSGQLGRYGDHKEEYLIHVDGEASRDEVLDYCFSAISKRKVQSHKEWMEAHGDAGKYFSGYYLLTYTEGEYMYTVIQPYAD